MKTKNLCLWLKQATRFFASLPLFNGFERRNFFTNQFDYFAIGSFDQ